MAVVGSLGGKIEEGRQELVARNNVFEPTSAKKPSCLDGTLCAGKS
jgi:hypothetical protein